MLRARANDRWRVGVVGVDGVVGEYMHIPRRSLRRKWQTYLPTLRCYSTYSLYLRKSEVASRKVEWVNAYADV